MTWCVVIVFAPIAAAIVLGCRLFLRAVDRWTRRHQHPGPDPVRLGLSCTPQRCRRRRPCARSPPSGSLRAAEEAPSSACLLNLSPEPVGQGP